MQVPVNFDSVGLDGLFSDWLCALREHAVEALVVLGPDPFGAPEARHVLVVHPPLLAQMATALADSRDFGSAWRESDAPLVAWQHIAKADPLNTPRWRRIALGHGYQTLVRVEFSLHAGRAFECFMFSPREMHDRSEAASLVWSALNVWPMVKRAIVAERCTLSPRELECLALAFEGLTAHESALRLKCTARTVNFHLARAMSKLKVDNKMAAIQRACWLGAL